MKNRNYSTDYVGNNRSVMYNRNVYQGNNYYPARTSMAAYPVLMDIKSPVAEARNEYTYTATGAKLKVKVKQSRNPNYSISPTIETDVNTRLLTVSKTTDYAGNKIYENGTLKMIRFDNGYYDNSDKKYYFYIKNHLGSVQAVAPQITTEYIIQNTFYYPFGMNMGISGGQDKQAFKYTGKELDMQNGLNMYDYSARYYDQTRGQFMSIDPLCEKYYWISVFVYCKNNPINRIDPDGRDDFFYNQAGDEINRIKTKKPDNFYLEHTDGNKTIGDKTYYQGASKESFFRDRGNDNKIEVFAKVDKEAMSSDQKIVETVDAHTRKGENQARFLMDSPEGKYYDYKNTVLGPASKDKIDNSKTAYMYEGILLNRNEAGNVFWGATARKLGFGIAGAIIGVQGFSLINEGKFDEKKEQAAIVRGMLIYDVYGKK